MRHIDAVRHPETSVNTGRCHAAPFGVPEWLVDNFSFRHHARPVHLALIVDLDPECVADRAVRHPDCAKCKIVLANRRPGGRGHETHLLQPTALFRINIGVRCSLVAFDIEFNETPRRSTSLFLCECPPSVEIRFLEIDQPAEAQFEW